MPKEVEVSICMSGSTCGQGVREWEADGLASESFHQSPEEVRLDIQWDVVVDKHIRELCKKSRQGR